MRALLLPRRMSRSHPEASPPSSVPPRSPDDPPTSSAESASAEAPFLIRSVRQSDLSALAEVLASSFHSQDGWMAWVYPLLKAGIYEDLKSRLHTRGPHYACLVAVQTPPQSTASPALVTQFAPFGFLGEASSGLIGTVEMSLKNPQLQPWNSKYLYLSNLAVLTEYRRQGVALQLLKACERIAIDWGFRNLYLHVLENNHHAKRLYWKAGYRLQRIEVNPLTMILGQPRQLFLRKQL